MNIPKTCSLLKREMYRFTEFKCLCLNEIGIVRSLNSMLLSFPFPKKKFRNLVELENKALGAEQFTNPLYNFLKEALIFVKKTA